jgi:hypothetical protein
MGTMMTPRITIQHKIDADLIMDALLCYARVRMQELGVEARQNPGQAFALSLQLTAELDQLHELVTVLAEGTMPEDDTTEDEEDNA